MFAKLSKSFWFNLAMVLFLCVVLFVSFFVALHKITAHGHELKIPAVKGKDISVAIAELKALHFEVSVDSVYEPAMKPLSVLRQEPDTGSVVKEGRMVFLTVNMLKPSKIPMPNLVGMSFASARMLLLNSKLLLGDTTYKPNIAIGSVLEQTYNGIPAWPGKMIQQGSKINLVLGNGAGKTEYDMPDVVGQSLEVALTVLSQYHLEVEIVSESHKPIDTATANVIDQDPKDATEDGVFNHVKRGAKVVVTVE